MNKLILILLSSILVVGCNPEEEVDLSDEAGFDRIVFQSASVDDGSSLTVSEDITINFLYEVASVDNARIFVRPHECTPDCNSYSAHPSPLFANGVGTYPGYFSLSDSTSMSKFRITMLDANDLSNTLLEVVIDYSIDWVNP